MRDMKKKGATSDYFAWVLNLQDLISDDLRYRWCNNNRNKVHDKCNVIESFRNHPPPPVHGKTVFHKTCTWCQNSWGLLLERLEPSYHSRFSSAVTSVTLQISWRAINPTRDPKYSHAADPGCLPQGCAPRGISPVTFWPRAKGPKGCSPVKSGIW